MTYSGQLIDPTTQQVIQEIVFVADTPVNELCVGILGGILLGLIFWYTARGLL